MGHLPDELEVVELGEGSPAPNDVRIGNWN
jgi:hypothetical protein